MSEMKGSAGGKALASKLSPEQRSASARRAAEARWNSEPPKEIIAGSPDRPIRIGDQAIECYVLSDGTRVLTQGSLLTALGRSPRLAGNKDGDAELPPILQGKALRPFIPDEIISDAMPIPFKHPSGFKASGYRAELLPKLCNVYLSANDAKALPPNQVATARAAEVLVRGLSIVGITALVDEATGYQEQRAKDALATILEAYVAEELQPWVKTFDPQFYKQMCRLRGIPFDPSSVKKPQYFGNLTNNIVYRRIAPGVFEEIKAERERDAKKKRARMHQQLTQDVGHPKLREHIASVTTVMRLNEDWNSFIAMLDKVHPIIDPNMPPPLFEDDGIGL
ncbi:P63C domain-containing protein [Leucobacter soli]|uniref:Bacteriophage Mx8 p63 C-terminal domain-containing protein n=1 Tax=Leucobacter soli TaxID=2812850 RepID=A0A916NPN4_9MICO|nr:P63C domain-containing protein [Leucobacter soli]CAG7622354.1 hypothetical protein LEUCIP111803_02508 [Leucobacter soli]